MCACAFALLLTVCFDGQPAELLSHLHDFVSSFKETVRISDEARKELQRQAAEKMVRADIPHAVKAQPHPAVAPRKPPPPPRAQGVGFWAG